MSEVQQLITKAIDDHRDTHAISYSPCMAESVIEALKQAGLMIVPKEPTAGMIISGAKAMTGIGTSSGNVIIGQPKDVYHAMIKEQGCED